jgi:hypothetical protein
MLASASSLPAGEEKQEAASVRHCKGVNDLDKVVLREVRATPQRYPSILLRVTGHVPTAGSRRRYTVLAMVLFEA